MKNLKHNKIAITVMDGLMALDFTSSAMTLIEKRNTKKSRENEQVLTIAICLIGMIIIIIYVSIFGG